MFGNSTHGPRRQRVKNRKARRHRLFGWMSRLPRIEPLEQRHLLAILNGGAGNDVLIGGSGDDILNGNDGDDLLDGRGGTNALDGGAGTDTILVTGTAGRDVIDAVHAAGTFNITGGISAGNNTITSMEAVRVEAGDESDSINVTTLAGGLLNYTILGGAGIGDSLHLNSASGVTFTPGTHSDSGALTDADGAVIAFQGTESVSVNANGNDVVVMGTGADDHITAVGISAGVVEVQVNDGPVVTYSGVSNVTLYGQNGDDEIVINRGLSELGVDFTVDGGSATAGSDTLTVKAIPGILDPQLVEPTAQGAGTVESVFTGAVVAFADIELVELVGQLNDGDTMNVGGTIGDDQLEYTPGATPDTGTITGTMDQTNATGAGPFPLVPVSFTGMFQLAALTFNNSSQIGGTDSLIYNGTAGDDAITASAGSIRNTVGGLLFSNLLFASITQLTVRGHDGDDTFDVRSVIGVPNFQLNIEGDNASNHTNVLNYNALGDVVLNLENSTIDDAGATGSPDVVYSGIDIVNVDANGNELTVEATSGDDTLLVRPTANDAASVESAGQPLINGSEIATFTVDADSAAGGNTGDDTVIVEADENNNAITVTDALVTIDAGGLTSVNLLNEEALTVDGRQGNDIIVVTQSPTVPIFIDGGGPIGTGDTLLVAPTAAPTFTPGPERDEGGFTAPGGAPVSFDHIEAVSVNLAEEGGLATVMGTGGDDDITAVGISANVVDVQVNDGRIVRYTSATNLTLHGKNGDDHITVDVNAVGLGVTINVDGGLPSSRGDSLRVTGVDGDAPDNVIYAPSGPNSGLLTVVGEAINISSVDHLTYDGESDDDNLRVDDRTRFVHTPGGTIDSGRVDTGPDEGVLNLGIGYATLGVNGTVTANGPGADDTLVALGTTDDDVVDITFTAADAIDIDLSSALGTHIDLRSSGVENYELRPLDGNDDLNVGPGGGTSPLINASGVFAVLAGGPAEGPAGAGDTLSLLGASDTAENVAIYPAFLDPDDQHIIGLGARMDVTGIELIRYAGMGEQDPDDTLTVNPGRGDNTVRVEASRYFGWDRVTSDSLPEIHFNNLQDFVVDAFSGGSDVVTFKTHGLEGALPGNYQMDGLSDDTLVIEGREGAHIGNDFFQVTNASGATPAGPVAIGETFGVTVTALNILIGHVVINTLGGNDAVRVDNSGGLINPLITFNGGSGSDKLQMTGSTPVANAEYIPGTTDDAGTVMHDGMRVDFTGLEPVHDNVVAANLTIQGTGADNTINYTAGPGGGIFTGNTGLVSVDNFETYEFSNKTNLAIDGQAGSDTINLNHQDSANAPDGLDEITVLGGDPANNTDTLILNGEIGVSGVLRITPTDQGAGTAVIPGPDATYIGIEAIDVVLQDADADSFAVNGTDGDDLFQLFSGTSPGRGTVRGFMDQNGVGVGPFSLPEINYQGDNQNGFSGFNDNAAGSDNFQFFASDANDNITIVRNEFLEGVIVRHEVDGQLINLVGAASLEAATIEAGNGDDDIRVTAVIAPGGSAPVVTVNGGNPSSGSDALTFVTGGALGTSTLLDLEARTIENTATVGTPDVVYSGIETINLDSVASSQPLAVDAFQGDDDIVVTPLTLAIAAGANNGTIQVSDVAPVVNYRGVTSVLVGGGGGQDTMIVNGTTAGTSAAPETFDVNGTTTTTPSGDVHYNQGGVVEAIEAVTVNGLEGDDLFNVTADPDVPIFIDGGDPIGSTAGDTIVVSGSAVFEPGPENDEGGFLVPGNERVSFDKIEAAVVTGGPAPSKAFISGDGDDNNITIIARDASTHAGADGIQDFTSTVDGGLEVLWLDYSQLVVDALSGDDDIVIRAPAPNSADWNVDAWIFGGAPAAGPGDEGDRLVVETPSLGPDAILYTPTAVDSGVLVIDEDGDGSSGGTDTVIQIGNVPAMPLMPDFPLPDPGGIETLVYDGEAGDDAITIFGEGVAPGPVDDIFTHTPGSEPDDGTMGVNSFLALNYTDLGLRGTIEADGVAGTDRLNVQGTQNVDAFDIASTTGTVSHTLSSGQDRVDVLQANIEVLVLDASAGDDIVDVAGSHPYAVGVRVNGGSPAADSDVLTFDGSGDPVTVDTTDKSISESGFAPVSFTSTETVNVDANGALLIDGTAGDDVVDVTPTGDGNDGSLLHSAVTGTTFHYTDASTITVDGDGGNDRLNVLGDEAANAVTADATTVAVDGSIVTFGNSLESLAVHTLGGNDTFTVDVNSGAVPLAINYDGGDESDLLEVTGQFPVVLIDTITYNVGPQVQEGRLSYDDDTDASNGVVMSIDFENLEPVADNVSAAQLVVNATDADNTINYTEGPGGGIFAGFTGLVSVDGFETIEFENKATLTINGRSGHDFVNLNNAQTPTQLDQINVNGHDPTGSDHVTVNGTPIADNIVIEQLTGDGALILDAQPVRVVVDTAEHLQIVGQGGNDTLTIVTPSGETLVDLVDGALTDAATIEMRQQFGDALLPIAFSGLGFDGTLRFTDTDDERVDELVLSAADTANQDVSLLIDSSGDIDLASKSAPLNVTELVTVETPSINTLRVHVFAGDDTVNIDGDHPFAAGVFLQGGEPSGSSDTLNFFGSGRAITADLGLKTVTEFGFGTVHHAGFEFKNVDGAAADVTVRTTMADDITDVTLLGPDTAMVINNESKPMLTVSSVGRLAVDQLTGDDVLQVRYTTGAETIDVDVLGGVITDGALETVNFDVATTEAVEVYGEQGDDTFNVTPGTSIPLFIDGGDPIGSSPGDSINVDAGGNAVILEAGPENDAGGIIVDTRARISYDHIEAMQVNNAAKTLVVGTNADDDITVIARDGSTHPANGERDFTVSVGAGPAVFFSNVPDLYIDALAGDDDIVIRAPAPNNTFWNVRVFVAGGPPSDGAANEGDRLVFETPGIDDIIYTPTGSETGEIIVDENGDDAYTAATDTLITMGGFVFPCPPERPYQADGGIELFEYDGEAGDDDLTILGDGAGADLDDVITHTVVDGVNDEGAFQVNNFLAINYQNVGENARLVVDGGSDDGLDTLEFFGTQISDVLTVLADPGGTDDNVVFHNLSLTVYTSDIDRLSLFGLQADDLFHVSTDTVNPNSDGFPQPIEVRVEGDDPSDSDVLTIVDTDAVNEDITVTHLPIPGVGAIEVLDTSAAVVTDQILFLGIELVVVDGTEADIDNLIVNGTSAQDDIDVREATFGDRISGNFQIPVEAAGSFDDVTIDVSQPGDDTVTFHLTKLNNAENQYTVVADEADVEQLVLVGTDAADIVTMPSPTSIRFSQGGGNDVVDFTTDQLDLITIQTLGADDTVRLNSLGVPSLVQTGAGDDLVALESLEANSTVEGGAGNDNVDGSSTTSADVQLTLYGQVGNDNLRGAQQGLSPGANLGDFIYGGPGDDVLEGGRGLDSLFGGADNDQFVWLIGDESDLVEGGTGEADQLVFLGDNGDQVVQLYGGGLSTIDPGIFPPQAQENGARAIVELGDQLAFLNTGDVESIYLDTGLGDDNIVINNQVDLVSGGDSPNALSNTITQGTDLAATTVRSVEVRPDLGDDYVEVHGTAGDDNIDVERQDTEITIEGASALVTVATGVGDDDLHIHGQGGNDNIKAADGVEALIGITLEGDAGEDILSADAILIGGPDDDLMTGGAGDDSFFGDAGEDTMIGGGGQDTYDGGPGFDTIQISGTSAADDIDVRQLNETTLVYLVRDELGNVIENATTGAGTEDIIANVEQAKVLAGEGSDTIFFSVRDELFDDPGASLRMTVEGGDDAASDRLGVLDHSDPDFDALPDLSILRQNQEITAGSVVVGPANDEPFLHVFSGIEFVQVVSDFPSTGQLFNVESPDLPNRLVVFKHDAYEHNHDRNNATHLGAITTVNLDPNIDPGPGLLGLPADTDWYRVEALVSGTIDFQVVFEQINEVGARPGLPAGGDLNINAFDSSGTPITGFTTSDDNDDNERVRIPAVQGEIYYFQVEGDGDAINAYDVTAINVSPAIPFDLELVDNPVDGTTNPPGGSDNSDTGRSQFDNHTYDTTPTVIFRLDDGLLLNDLPGNDVPGNPLGDEAIPIPFHEGPLQPNLPGYAIAVFDEGATAPAAGNDGGLTVRQPLGFATMIEPGLYEFTVPGTNELDEGSHFLTARVQMLDPADPLQTGFGERSQSLEIVVDVTPPPVVFGLAADATDGLHPDSDSGDPSAPATFIDRITNDETPTFFGRAEANSIVRLYLDLDGDSVLDDDDLLIGQTTAIPLDGTEQLETPANPLEPGGQWQITSTVNMNDPAVLTALGEVKDGLRTILLSAEDLAGNITAPDENEILEIFVDTQGPQVTDVFITGREDFNLFALKPETPEPTPRVDSLTIAVRDLPPRIAGFLYDAVSNVPPLAPIVLVGDHSGPIAIDNLFYDPISDGPGIASGDIVLEFNDPLPDDRFTLTVMDNVIDPVGNQLDGENNAAEPIGDPFFPSGDQLPGGDFIARFTVDSRPEVATWSQGVVYADINGNFVWDPEGEDNDFTNRDFAYNFGEITDAYFVGNFSQVAASSGFDKLGAYGRFLGVYQFFLDTNDDGVGDIVPSMFYQVNAIPVAGNFARPEGNAVPDGERPRDEIGAYDGNNWYLDVNGNNAIDGGERLPTTMRGVPFVGDFNGDGFDDLATYNNNTGEFQFDLNRSGNADDTITFGFPGFGDKPIAGDFNLDGVDDIGLWVPGQEGQLPKDSGEFHFLLSDRDPIGGPTNRPVINVGPSSIFDDFSPAPLGNDLISQFGDEFALPLWGNFDPPIANDGGGATFVGSLTNETNPMDTNVDGAVSALDALLVINALGRGDLTDFSQPLRVVASLGGHKLDASDDGLITSRDALVIINSLGQETMGQPSAEAEAEQVSWADSVAPVFAEIGSDDEEDELLELLAADEQRVF